MATKQQRPIFKQGDRVIRLETGQTGTVCMQFIDGYVSLMFDNGTPAELRVESLKRITKRKPSSHPRQ